MVGTGRFELPTPRTPSECSTRLSHVPTIGNPLPKTGIATEGSHGIIAQVSGRQCRSLWSSENSLSNNRHSQGCFYSKTRNSLQVAEQIHFASFDFAQSRLYGTGVPLRLRHQILRRAHQFIGREFACTVQAGVCEGR